MPATSKSNHGKVRTDVVLPMKNIHMQQIIRREKNYEFRRYLIPSSVERVWFYLSAPFSHLAYVCEILPAHTRNPGDEPLDEDGVGNKEFNEHHRDWDKFNYAYRIKSAPRGMVYAPDDLLADVSWRAQEHIWTDTKLAVRENPPALKRHSPGY